MERVVEKLHTIRHGFQSDESDVTEFKVLAAPIRRAPKLYTSAIAAAPKQEKKKNLTIDYLENEVRDIWRVTYGDDAK